MLAVAKASQTLLVISLVKTDHVTINEDALEKAKAELRNYTWYVVSGLNQTGVRAVPLDTQELIEVYMMPTTPTPPRDNNLKTSTI